MSTPLDSFDELTDFGVMGRPELADILDSQEVKVLEERFLAKGTVVVTKDGSILQAVHVRGSSRAREVWFAPSSSSRQTLAANKIRASEVYTAGDLTHVFMNLLGRTFVRRSDVETEPPSTIHFKVLALQAAAAAKELEGVQVIAMLGGSSVGDPIVVAAKLFFLSYTPLDAGPRPQQSGGAGGAGVPGLLGTFDISAQFPQLHVSLVAMGAGTAVQYSGAEVAAYAAVALGGWLADTREEAESAGEALECVLAEEASPQRSKLKLLHRLGAVAAPRPGLGGRAIRQCYFPERLMASDGSNGKPWGEAALVGSPFAEASYVVPPDPGDVEPLRKPETKAARIAREQQEAAAAESARDAERAEKRRARKRQARKARRARSSGSGSSSSDDSRSSASSKSSASSASGAARPRRHKQEGGGHSRAGSRQQRHAPGGDDILKSITPQGGDTMRAAAALFETARLREAAGFEELPPQSEWAGDRRPGLLRRCTLAVERLDVELGGQRWRAKRPNNMAAVFVLAEETAALLGTAGASTSRGAPATKRRRPRSPSSGSSSESSGSGKRKSKRKVASGTGGATISPDAAEALNKARHFVERACGDDRGRGATGEAVASLPVELRALVQRALTSDKVAGKSEHRACRRELPSVVLRMRDSLSRDIARALETHMSADMSGFSELPRPKAEALAHGIRRLDLSLEKAIEGVKAARGSRAPKPGSALELQDAWALLRAGLDELERTVPAVGRAAELVAAQLSTGAAASGVSVERCKEWLKKVFITFGTMAADARDDIKLRLPTLRDAVSARAPWLMPEVFDARQDARFVARLGEVKGGPGGKPPKAPPGEKAPGEKVPGGKGKGAPGKGEPKEGRAARLWVDKPFVNDEQFKLLRGKFQEKFPGSCWFAIRETHGYMDTFRIL